MWDSPFMDRHLLVAEYPFMPSIASKIKNAITFKNKTYILTDKNEIKVLTEKERKRAIAELWLAISCLASF